MRAAALITKNDSKDFYLTISENPCIQVFYDQQWEMFISNVNKMSKQQQCMMRPIFVTAERVSIHERTLTISTHMLERFNLRDKEFAALVENDKGFEIWDKDIYDARSV